MERNVKALIILSVIFVAASVVASFGDTFFSARFYTQFQDEIGSREVQKIIRDDDIDNAEPVLRAPNNPASEALIAPDVIQPVKVPILVYHIVRDPSPDDPEDIALFTVSPALFEEELRFLAEGGYHTISPDDLVAYFSGKPLPQKPVLLAFDDGWEMQYRNAFPLLQKYGFTAAFFIFTNAIGHEKFLSRKEIIEMDLAGMTIGGHSKTHPYLFDVNDEAKLRAEFFESKAILEAMLLHPLYAFSYPFGQADGRMVSLAREAGYTFARTIREGTVHTADDLLALKSVLMTNSFNRFLNALQ